MSEETVRQIADSLGVAFDQAWAIVPQYANMKLVGITALIICLLLIFIGLVFALIKIFKAYKKEKSKDYAKQDDDYVYLLAASFIGLVVILIIVFVPIIFNIVQALQWAMYPDAKMVDMLIGAVA